MRAPTARLLVLKVATPELRVPVPSVVVPSMKCHRARRRARAREAAATVAVNVTD